MLNGATTRKTWRAWLLLAVACWACVVPAWAFAPGVSVREAKTRVGFFCANYGEARPAQPVQVAETHREKCAARYDSASGPTVGLYYNRARYLNADSGRFWSMDPIEGDRAVPQTRQLYLYANSNPVLFRDPSGFSSAMGFGRVVHKTVGLHFTEGDTNPFRLRDRSMGSIVGIKSIGDLIDRPDLIDFSSYEIYEIKTTKEYSDGVADLAYYIGVLNAIPGIPVQWRFGMSYSYTPAIVPLVGMYVYAEVYPTMFGVITHDIRVRKQKVVEHVAVAAVVSAAISRLAAAASAAKLAEIETADIPLAVFARQ